MYTKNVEVEVGTTPVPNSGSADDVSDGWIKICYEKMYASNEYEKKEFDQMIDYEAHQRCLYMQFGTTGVSKNNSWSDGLYVLIPKIWFIG